MINNAQKFQFRALGICTFCLDVIVKYGNGFFSSCSTAGYRRRYLTVNYDFVRLKLRMRKGFCGFLNTVRFVILFSILFVVLASDFFS